LILGGYVVALVLEAGRASRDVIAGTYAGVTMSLFSSGVRVTRSRRKRRTVRVAFALIVLTISMALPTAPASAWNVYTHEFTGSQVQADQADGSVTLAGHNYPVDSRVNSAIGNWPSYFNAGVVGPDGYPDTAYGEVTIHPGNKPDINGKLPYGVQAPTGAWLGYLLSHAWGAQTDASYSADEKAQILAFTYGFLTHAAGDTWAHTLMNDYSGAVYPAIPDVLSSLPAAQMALRHLITEEYIGSTAPHFDAPDGEDDTADCGDPDVGPPDTLCNVGTPDEKRVEVSRVCTNDAIPPTPRTECTTEGPGGSDVSDYSANATPGIQLDVPKRYIQRTMVNLNTRTPADGCEGDGDGDYGCPDGTYDPDKPQELTRGPILDRVLDEEAKLQIYAAKVRDDQNHSDCSTSLDSDCHSRETLIFVDTVRGRASVRVHRTFCTAEFFCIASGTDALYDATIAPLIAGYAEAWVDDINTMQDHWAEFGLAVTRGWFDPQTHRNAANDECSFGAVGPETLTNNARNKCEAGVGLLDSIHWSLDHMDGGSQSWINDYLIPAAGLPDFVGDIKSFLAAVGDAIDDLFTFIGVTNPLSQIKADISAFIDDKINEFIADQTGVDPEAIGQFAKTMAQWMCGNDGTVSFDIPGVGTITPSMLFTTAEHDRLDGLMGLPADHHEEGEGLPEQCSPVKDDARMNPAQFAPLKNTITLGKMLLLDGPTLNSALGTTLVDGGVIRNAGSVHTYGGTALSAPANVMVDHLQSNGQTTHFSSSQAWLQLIDGDHAWRRDGLPRFSDPNGFGGSKFCLDNGYSIYDPNSTCTPVPLPTGMARQPEPRALISGQFDGGRGNFPVWESCLLRPAFRTLFTDWENGSANFPDLGDTASPDASVPNPPGANLDSTGTFTSANGFYAGSSNQFTLSYHDFVFTDAQTQARYRVYKDGATPGAFQSIANGGTFAVSGTDGLYHIEYQTQDPCHTYNPDDLLATPLRTVDVVLDTTPPTVTYTQPALAQYATDQFSSIQYAVSDLGSGVASDSVTLDGNAATNGQTLDMFFLVAGLHTIVVTATDNLGNTGTTLRVFRVRATSASLLNNLDRARSLGLVPDAKVYKGLRDSLTAASQSHSRGQHPTEWNQLSAFVNQVLGQLGHGIDGTVGLRLIGYARDLIASRG
jgi:hypothetical protein